MKTENLTKKVVVAMSGGVDSSLSAFLLKERGYEVIGITMKLWDYAEVGGDLHQDGRCCSLEAMNDALAVCQKLGIPHYVLDFRKEFKEKVISNFVNVYFNGRTPNPCIVCNSEMKWKILWKKAEELGANFLATGHYAKVKLEQNSQRYQLLKGKDLTRDQSYALWGLSQKNLATTIFPLGEFTKKEVREIAQKNALKVANKSESEEICFIPDDDYPRFLKNWIKDIEISTGPIFNLKKEKIGEHQGIPFYTIGQRKGLRMAVGHPLYVIKILPSENSIYVGENKELFSSSFVVSDLNWVSIPPLKKEISCQVKIRYQHSPAPATISPLTEREILVIFQQNQRAITPGQSAVFYEGDVVLGGGIIEKIKE
jgi:tRNA-specific 2-thiouridylase